MTVFFVLHLILTKNLETCRRDKLFFALHLILGGNLAICVFFALYLMRNCIYMCLMIRNIGMGNLVMSDCKVKNH